MMKSLKYTSFFLFVVILIPFQLQSQERVARDKMERVAKEIMTNATSCTLITVDEDNIARARAMDAFPAQEDFVVWFGTNVHSRKLTQIKQNNKVTLYYIDPDLSGYVLLHGIATIVDSQEEKDKWWKEAWKDFYDEKRSDYMLIKVSPVWMEVISTKHGILGDKTNWEVPRIYFNQ